ncbi:Hypothetical Protein FCC1311_099682 [Hondaea fermentalgiana]|uniref:Autophagy-related protein 27 n=1 Tax=Hondaea fermentalgiana TaxID=2315210 RepID=A0A2R5GT27_9STRA|nr:Hypothetical Protein FCC1311_099682 [Hondaea fermentalgiana]|eukprot:GBG33745.1 Hypothetical Protein FCC1311_099682 [Hondaea fermentalgiana]
MAEQQLSAIFYVNICEPVVAGVTEKGPCADHPDAVAVSVNYQTCQPWGLLQNEQPWKGINGNVGAGIETTYAGPSDGLCAQGRVTRIQIKCEETITAPTFLDTVTVGPDHCEVTFLFRSKTGCGTPVGDAGASGSDAGNTGAGGSSPTAPSSSPGHKPASSPTQQGNAHSGSSNDPDTGSMSVFLTLLLVGTFLYCVIGIFLNMRNEGREGLEAVPHIDFWRALPALVVHAAAITFSWVKGLLGFGAEGGYHSFSPTSARSGNVNGAADYSMPPPPSSGGAAVSPTSESQVPITGQPRGPSGEYTVI